MSKLEITLMFAMPQMKIAAQLLRKKDANSTGSDDIAADIMDYAADAVTAVQNGFPLPDLPASLRPKEKVDTAPLAD